MKNSERESEARTRDLQRKELGRFLRARREALAPAEVGLADHRRRRTPGLRREEVALLANIGIAWYSKLEMAHDIQVSTATLSAIADALRLTPAERDYAFALADVSMPRVAGTYEPGLPEAIEQLIPCIHGVGAVLWDRYLTALRWNDIADAMFDFSACPDPLDRNSVLRLNRDTFRVPYYGADHESLVRSLVGMFRKAYVMEEPSAFAERIYERARELPLFQKYWNDQSIAEDLFNARPGPFERHHPLVGTYSVITTHLRVIRRDDLFIRIMAPADAASLEKFKLLALRGTASTRETRLPE